MIEPDVLIKDRERKEIVEGLRECIRSYCENRYQSSEVIKEGFLEGLRVAVRFVQGRIKYPE